MDKEWWLSSPVAGNTRSGAPIGALAVAIACSSCGGNGFSGVASGTTTATVVVDGNHRVR